MFPQQKQKKSTSKTVSNQKFKTMLQTMRNQNNKTSVSQSPLVKSANKSTLIKPTTKKRCQSSYQQNRLKTFHENSFTTLTQIQQKILLREMNIRPSMYRLSYKNDDNLTINKIVHDQVSLNVYPCVQSLQKQQRELELKIKQRNDTHQKRLHQFREHMTFLQKKKNELARIIMQTKEQKLYKKNEPEQIKHLPRDKNQEFLITQKIRTLKNNRKLRKADIQGKQAMQSPQKKKKQIQKYKNKVWNEEAPTPWHQDQDNFLLQF